MADSTDWRETVRRYSAKGAEQAAAVENATQQAEGLMGTPEFWEAVYTLAVQAVQMTGGEGESR